MSDTTDMAVVVKNLHKSFKLPHEQHSGIKQKLVNVLKGKKGYEIQHVLNDVSFEIKKGEFFGIVGRNGSGKSTLLKLLAGIYVPDKGLIQVNGSLTPFIELGVGFNPELTGRENVFLNGALLGFSKSEVENMYDYIVEFAELEKFMDQKLKNYSSGMQVRLAFSIAIRAQSDILLLDEVLAVGDAVFQKKCFEYFRELKANGRTVLFISHDVNSVREYCDRAILVDKGRVSKVGSAEDIAQEYTKILQNNNSDKGAKGSDRWGSGDMIIEDVKYLLSEDELIINVAYLAKKDVDWPVFGVTINSSAGVRMFESNTVWKHIKTNKYKAGSKVKVTWRIPNIFTNGVNYITAAAADMDGYEIYDWWNQAESFIIDKDLVTTAVTLPKYEVTVND